VRVPLVLSALLLAGCASTGGLPRQPFTDIPVAEQWQPYSRDWVVIETPGVTAAKLVYFTKADVAATLAEVRRLMPGSGWRERATERFVNAEGFQGQWADYTKGDDICRVTVIEGATATHVDLTLARRSARR
jgi:hypothetical protein